MKKNLLSLVIVIVVLLVIAIGFVAYFLFASPTPQTVPTPQNNPAFPTSGQQTTQTPDQATQAKITQDFHTQVPQSNNLVLLRTALVGQYAIASWQDQYVGGTVVLQEQSTNDWKIIVMDGGVLAESDLVKVGIPASTADLLLTSQQSP